MCTTYVQIHWRIQGGARDTPPGPNFFHFHTVFGENWPKIIGWRPHLCGWRPVLWEILDPILKSSIWDPSVFWNLLNPNFNILLHYIIFMTIFTDNNSSKSKISKNNQPTTPTSLTPTTPHTHDTPRPTQHWHPSNLSKIKTVCRFKNHCTIIRIYKSTCKKDSFEK